MKKLFIDCSHPSSRAALKMIYRQSLCPSCLAAPTVCILLHGRPRGAPEPWSSLVPWGPGAVRSLVPMGASLSSAGPLTLSHLHKSLPLGRIKMCTLPLGHQWKNGILALQFTDWLTVCGSKSSSLYPNFASPGKFPWWLGFQCLCQGLGLCHWLRTLLFRSAWDRIEVPDAQKPLYKGN
jgi:hypothetical protein